MLARGREELSCPLETKWWWLQGLGVARAGTTTRRSCTAGAIRREGTATPARIATAAAHGGETDPRRRSAGLPVPQSTIHNEKKSFWSLTVVSVSGLSVIVCGPKSRLAAKN